MPDPWNMNNKPVRNLTDAEILADIMRSLFNLTCSSRAGGWEIKKVNKRRSFNQAVYAVAKKFGHRSAYKDLEFLAPGMTIAPPFHGKWIPIPEITRHGVYYRLMFLGRESQKGATGTSTKDRLSGNTAAANQVQINVRGQQVSVEMDLTAPAFYNLCKTISVTKGGYTGANRVSGPIKAKLLEKWGAENAAYGMYTQHTALNDEGYEVVRMHNGVPVTMFGIDVVSTVGLPGLGSHKQHSHIGQMMGGHRRR